MITFDAIKSAYRQTKDGYTVTFVIHPQDGHDELMAAPIGTPARITWEPLDEDGNPPDADLPTADDVRGILKQPDAGAVSSPARETGSPQPHDRPHAAPVSRSLPQKIGALCANGRFQAFLRHALPNGWGKALQRFQDDEDIAAEVVRIFCGVSTRKAIIPNAPAGNKWVELEFGYEAWLREPEVVG